MIKRTIKTEVTPTPREAEEEIWCMDPVKQVDFILAMTQRFSNNKDIVELRLSLLKEKFDLLLNEEEKQNVISVFEDIVNALKKQEE